MFRAPLFQKLCELASDKEMTQLLERELHFLHQHGELGFYINAKDTDYGVTLLDIAHQHQNDLGKRYY